MSLIFFDSDPVPEVDLVHSGTSAHVNIHEILEGSHESEGDPAPSLPSFLRPSGRGDLEKA